MAFRINLENILYIFAFLSFGIADGISGAYMMMLRGIDTEANTMIKYVFMANGFGGVVYVKIALTLALLFMTYVISSKHHMRWSVNGFLLALILGGMMATNANINVIIGEAPQPPENIIFLYLIFVLLFTEIGSILDRNRGYEYEQG